MLDTERLHIREINIHDAEFHYRLMNSPDWIKYIGDRNIHSVDDAKVYLENKVLKGYQDNGFGSYLVLLKDTEIPIGVCGIYKRDSLENEDFGFAFLPEYFGKGYAFEAATTILDFVKREYQFKRLLAITVPYNLPSIKLLEKLGFSFLHHITIPNDDEQLSLYAKDLN